MRVSRFTDPSSPDYNEAFDNSLPLGIGIMQPDVGKGMFFEVNEEVIIGATCDATNLSGPWIRVGDVVTLNCCYGGPEAKEGRLVAIVEPHKRATTDDKIFLVRLAHKVLWCRWRDFEF